MAEQQLTENQRFWLEHLRACSRAGGSLAQYASGCGLKVKTMYVARGRLKALGLFPDAEPSDVPATKFLRVKLNEPAAPSSLPCRVQLPNGVHVELAVSTACLDAVLRAVASL